MFAFESRVLLHVVPNWVVNVAATIASSHLVGGAADCSSFEHSLFSVHALRG